MKIVCFQCFKKHMGQHKVAFRKHKIVSRQISCDICRKQNIVTRQLFCDNQIFDHEEELAIVVTLFGNLLLLACIYGFLV